MTSENIEIKKSDKLQPGVKGPEELDVTAIIPLRAHYNATIDLNETLIRRCAESIRESRYINRVVVSSDDESLAKLAARFENSLSIIRPEHLSDPTVRLSEVLKYTLLELKNRGIVPEILVPVEITYPFRPKGILDHVIEMLVSNDFNTVIAGVAEYRVCWKKEEGRFVQLSELSKPRNERSPLHIGLPSLACALYPDVVESGKRYGDRLGIFEVHEPFAAIEVRTPEQLEEIAQQFYWPQ